MTPRASGATAGARQLWVRFAADATTPDAAGAAADQVCSHLRSELGRWIGAVGYLALLNRALAVAQAEHPVLDGLPCIGGSEAAFAAAAQAHGVSTLADGMTALVAALIELLGRIVGDDLAVRLVGQLDTSITTGTPGDRQGGAVHG